MNKRVFLCVSCLCKYFALYSSEQCTTFHMAKGYGVQRARKKRKHISYILPHFHLFCMKLAVLVRRMLVPFNDAQISY